MTRQGRLLALLAFVLLGLGTACGNGNDRPATRADYIDELTEELRDPQEEFELDEKSARCLAESFVDVIGFERLDDVSPEGIATESLPDLGVSVTEATTARLAEVFRTCPWLHQIIGDTLSAELGSELSSEAVDCLADYTRDDTSAQFAEYVSGSGSERALERSFEDALTSGFVECPDANAEFFMRAIALDGVQIEPGGEECVRELFRSRPDEAGAAASGSSESERAAFFGVIEQSCGQYLRRVPSN